MAATLWFAEQRVNTTTAGGQQSPSITRLANGGFVVVWQDNGTGAGDVRGQRYDAAGLKVGVEFVVSATGAAEGDPSVTAFSDGRFAVSFESAGSMPTRYFNADATLQMETLGGAGTTNPSLLSRPDNGAVLLVESSTDILVVQFNPAGAFETAVFVNTTIAGTQRHPDVAQLAGGRYAIVWITEDVEVRARLMDSAGNLLGAGDFAVNATPIGDSNNGRAVVVALANGGFVVAWPSNGGGFPGDSVDIRARLFDANGVAFGSDFLVNTTVVGFQNNLEIVPLADGGFLAAWLDFASQSLRGRQFDAFATGVGPEFQISTTPMAGAGFPRNISATLLDDGRLAIVWSGASGLGDNDGAVHLQIVDPRDGQVVGTNSANLLYGGQFEDQIVALSGADTVHALAGADVIYGGPGNDSVFAGLGDDSLYGGVDNDLLNAGTGADVVHGELGDDTVFAELGDDLIFGGDGNDTLNAGAGQDAIYGQNGDDVTFGEDGADAFFLGFGNDTAFCGTGNDVAFGEEGGDSLLGEAGDDFLDGGAGGDFLVGGAGIDNLIGGGDGDVMVGGADGDRVEGGTGADIYWYQAQSEGNDLIVGFVGADDQLQFTGAAFGFAPAATLALGVNFINGAAPTSATPTFYYNAGSLFFDPDGTGAQGPVFIALLQGAPALTAGDFQFV